MRPFAELVSSRRTRFRLNHPLYASLNQGLNVRTRRHCGAGVTDCDRGTVRPEETADRGMEAARIRST